MLFIIIRRGPLPLLICQKNNRPIFPREWNPRLTWRQWFTHNLNHYLGTNKILKRTWMLETHAVKKHHHLEYRSPTWSDNNVVNGNCLRAVARRQLAYVVVWHIIGHVSMVAIIGTTTMVSYLWVKPLQLNWRSCARRFRFWVKRVLETRLHSKNMALVRANPHTDQIGHVIIMHPPNFIGREYLPMIWV